MAGRQGWGTLAVLACACLAPRAHAQEAPALPEAPTVRCPDGTGQCVAVPGVAVPTLPRDRPVIVSEPGPWSMTVSGGVAPRDGGPTGSYEAGDLRRQIGNAYVQAGVLHYDSPMLAQAVSVASGFTVGTLAGGGQLGNWLVDGYVSYGWQSYGQVRVAKADGSALVTRGADGASGSPYYGAGASLGRIMPVGQRWFVTSTAALTYSWGRWLHPVDGYAGPHDFLTGEATWTGTARVRVDRLMGRTRRSYLGLSVAGVLSSNASSLAGSGGVVGPGLPDASGQIRRLRDPWVEVAAHGSMALTRRMRVEVTAARTAGLVTGNTTTVNLGLRRQF
jgi:hypothetical protein